MYKMMKGEYRYSINPFAPSAPFFYPLKTSENLQVFLCFQGVEKGCIENKCVKKELAEIRNGNTLQRSEHFFEKNVFWNLGSILHVLMCSYLAKIEKIFRKDSEILC